MNYRIDVEVTTPLNPTESRERVETAIGNLFPEAEIVEADGRLVGQTHSFARFVERVREQSIVDAARDRFRAGIDADGFSFALKKQAAYVGVVNFSVGGADELGDLSVHVRVEGPAVEAFIDHVLPASQTGDR